MTWNVVVKWFYLILVNLLAKMIAIIHVTTASPVVKPEDKDITDLSIQLLHLIDAFGTKKTMIYLIEVARGANTKATRAQGHHTLEHFGCAKKHSKPYLSRVILKLEREGYIDTVTDASIHGANHRVCDYYI